MVTTTISHSGARSSAPARTAQKIRLSQQQNVSTTAVATSALSSKTTGQNEARHRQNSASAAGVVSVRDEIAGGFQAGQDAVDMLAGIDKLDVTSLQTILSRLQNDVNILTSRLNKSLDSNQINKIVDDLASQVILAASASNIQWKNGKKKNDTHTSSALGEIKLNVLKVR